MTITLAELDAVERAMKIVAHVAVQSSGLVDQNYCSVAATNALELVKALRAALAVVEMVKVACSVEEGLPYMPIREALRAFEAEYGGLLQGGEAAQGGAR